MKRSLISLFLVFMLILQCSAIAFSAESEPADFYSQNTTHNGDSALSVIADESVAQHFENIQDTNNYDVVSASSQTVFVMNTLNDEGEVTESRLMTEQEVQDYNARTATSQNARANTWVGEDGENHQGGKLSIYLVVYKDSSRNYYVYGTADWANGVYSGGVNGPSSGYDFMAISWGGNGELKNSSSSDRSISGIYQYGQGNISFSRAQSDAYRGYCWQFNDTKGIYFADYIDCYAKLQKTYSTYRGKQTSIRLTYIHTYQQAVGSVSFSGGNSGVAAGVSLSSCDKQWQIEVDIPGIYY